MTTNEVSSARTEQEEPTAERPDSERSTTGSAQGEEIFSGTPEHDSPSEIATSSKAEYDSNRNNLVLQGLTRRVEELADVQEEANRLSRERERIIDRLHQENQQLRAGEIWQVVAPVLRDLVRLYDDLKQTAQLYEECSELDLREAARDFQSFTDAVEDILYRQGVERYEALVASPFNSKEQKALGVVPTEDPTLDRSVARVVRVGFRADLRIVRILEAEVFRFTPAVNGPTEEEGLNKTESETAD